jgi:hypothetical protein
VGTATHVKTNVSDKTKYLFIAPFILSSLACVLALTTEAGDASEPSGAVELALAGKPHAREVVGTAALV